MNKKLFAILFGALALFACQEPEEPEQKPEEPVAYPEIPLVSPEDGTEYDLNEMASVLSFGWTEIEEFNSYRLQFALTPDFEVLESVSTKANPAEVGIVEMDEVLGLLGLPEAKSAYVYWRVAPLRSEEFTATPKSVFVTRLDPSKNVIAPADGMRYNLDDQQNSISFEWRPAIGATKHTLYFALNKTFSKNKAVSLGAKDGRYSISATTLDGIAGELGVEPDATCDIYWKVVPEGEGIDASAYGVRMITIERKYPYILTTAPANNHIVNLEEEESVVFSWDKSSVSRFYFDIALSDDFSDMERIDVGNKNTYTITTATLESWLEAAGIEPGALGVFYWRVSPQSGKVMASPTQVLIAKRVNTSIEMLSPANSANYSCNSCDDIFFEWKPIEGICSYAIEFAQDEEFKSVSTYMVNAESAENKETCSSVYINIDWLDAMLESFGVEEYTSAPVYWRVVPQGEHNKELTSRRLVVERKDPALFLPYEERLFDQKKTIYVEVLFEDPIVYHDDLSDADQGKRLSQVTTIHGNKWWEPMEQLVEYEAALEEAAHGLVDFVIVQQHKIWEDDRFEPNELPYSYYIGKDGRPSDENGKALADGAPRVTLKYNKYREWCVAKDPPGLGDRVTYDYIKMLTDPRLATDGKTIAERVDLGLVQEVWVLGGPVSGLNESKLIGDGAFWCNSTGLTKEMGAPCDKLVCVMGCSFERSTDLAIHCWGHRFESIMSHVYGDFKQFYENRYAEKQLNNWERFCGYKGNYGSGKFPEQVGYAHIGFCHFPPNGDNDYDYYEKAYFNTYADEWLDYPRIRMNKRKARRVNCEDWKKVAPDADDPYQMGYMIWYLGHMPHFNGLNMADGHLNNWWYYVVDIKGALEYEKQLREEFGWQDPNKQ